MSATVTRPRWRTVGTCSTGRLRFPTEEWADEARRRAVAEWGEAGRDLTGRPLPMNVRPCRVCQGWHWTTKATKKWASGKHGRKNPMPWEKRRNR